MLSHHDSRLRAARRALALLGGLAITLSLSWLRAESLVAQQPGAPRPVLPIPSGRQLDWQRRELALFVHFGVNTFTGREWGTGHEEPAVFRPSELDAVSWVRVGRETGFRTLILTAKHHDGFALWPSRYTDHSVRSSPWRGGAGDVVRELAAAVRAQGLQLGLYLSPWDMHEPSYGDEAAYNQFYLGQLRELLSDYGPVAELWFDGAKGPDAKDMDYDFEAYWALVRQLQPNAVIFSDEGPDVRWIGNEHGFAGETNWSMLDRSRVSVGAADTDYLNSGDPWGPDWVPGECDVSIRDGWFWHADQEPKSLDALLEIYFKSVGRNCVLLLNVPPNRDGRLDAKDVARLYEFRAALDTIFATDAAAGKPAIASNVRGESEVYSAMRALDGNLDTYWATDDTVESGLLEVDLGGAVPFNVIRIQEPVQLGQRVSAYRVAAEIDGRWRTVHAGTTIGHKKLDRIETITASRVRLIIDRARANPLIAELGIHFDPAVRSRR